MNISADLDVKTKESDLSTVEIPKAKVADDTGSKQFSKQQKKQQKNAPFRRVVEEEIFVPEELQDNSFAGKKNASGDWGSKASLDLIVTRGKSFRHEKTKKKR